LVNKNGYFRTQALWPLLLSLAALASLALLTQSLQTLDLIVENQQSALTFFKITFLALPQLIAIILPLSVFMAVLYALNRLHSDSELYAREIGTDGTLKDILIYDSRDTGGATTHTAKQGEVLRQGSLFLLSLQDGSVQQDLEDGSVDVVEFEDYSVDLSDAVAIDTALRLKTSDRYLYELLRPNPRELLSRKIKNEYIAEGHARLSSPLYNLALVCLALSFMVRGEHLRLGYGRRIALCAFVGFLIRLTGFGLASASESNASLNPLQYALPLSVIILCLIYLSRSKRRMRRGSKKRKAAYEEGLKIRAAKVVRIS